MTTRYAGPKYGFVSSPSVRDYVAEIKQLKRELTAECKAREEAEECLTAHRNAHFGLIKHAEAAEDLASQMFERTKAFRNCLQDLSEALLALGKYGFDKNAIKDETAFVLWTNLNTAQAQARQTLDALQPESPLPDYREKIEREMVEKG